MLSRDPRVDSSPPSGQEDMPMKRPSLRPADAAVARLASLEAEIARLKKQHADDADQLAAMLVRIADVERARIAAEQRAAESDRHAEMLSTALGKEKARASQLEAEAWEASETTMRELRTQLEAARKAMASTLSVLEDLERREEMVTAVRLRAIEQMRLNLGGPATLRPAPAEAPPIQAMPIRSIAPAKPMKEMMAEPEPFEELDFSK